MDEAIPLIPEVPRSLRSAALQAELVPFVGAGVSRLAGCPGWDAFAEAVLEALHEDGCLNAAELDQLSGLNPRVRLSIAISEARASKCRVKFETILSVDECDLGCRAYGALSTLSKVFITTNYDRWLDDVRPMGGLSTEPAGVAAPIRRTVLHRPDQFTPDRLTMTSAVFHIHGSVVDSQGMVITTPEYLRRYSQLNDFLAHLFRTRRVLFVGYGLEELEILEYVLKKAVALPESDATVSAVEPRHFALFGFYSHQMGRMKFLERYFQECNVRLLPFRMDESGHAQLVKVLEDFARKLPCASRHAEVMKDFQDMRSLLDAE